MRSFSWTCPFCNQIATIGRSDIVENKSRMIISNNDGLREITTQFIVCPNEKCKKISLKIILNDLLKQKILNTYQYAMGEVINEWQLIPKSNARVFPDYVPQAIITDYVEACRILSLSPKASATLSRRCLQGMIRDYFGIKKNRLIDEIEAIQNKIDPLTWKSLDSVRKIGNIGAHMEKDINLIIEVEENEADILIQLIEQLIVDWYVVRYEREKRLKDIVAISEKKEIAKKK